MKIRSSVSYSSCLLERTPGVPLHPQARAGASEAGPLLPSALQPLEDWHKAPGRSCCSVPLSAVGFYIVEAAAVVS